MKEYILFALVLTVIYITPSFSKNNILKSHSADDSLKVIEKVYLHIDRDSYYPGDDIWFKAYLVDASDRFLSNHSGNLHVELISPSFEIIKSHIIKLNDGLGHGDFHLPDSLISGKYRLRAYTNYMRNFSDDLFFNKNITIFNSSDSDKFFLDNVKAIIDKPEISFFPEGGSLVDNVTSVIAFKALDAHGNGYDVTGEIYSSTDEKVTTFKSTHKGMGAFLLQPVTGSSYYAVVKTQNGEKVRFEIPRSFSTGVVLTVSRNQTGKLSLKFKTNTATLPLFLDHDLSLTVTARGLIFKKYSFRMKSLHSFLNIPVDDLPDGIVMLTLTGIDNMSLCERLVYLQNSKDARINLETDKKVYSRRDSVGVKISMTVNSSIPQYAFLSLSAADNIFTDNSSRSPSTISSWFLLESDVRGLVEEPSYYFDLKNPNRLKDLDLLLLTQGWRDFEWKYKNMKYPPEYGFTISGRVRKKFVDGLVKNSKVNIGIFHNGKPLIAILPTDSSGRFLLKGVDLTGEANLIASAAAGMKDQLQGWLLLDSLKYSPPEILKVKFPTKQLINDTNIENDTLFIEKSRSLSNKIRPFIQYAEFRKSIQYKYRLSDTIKPGEVKIIAKREDTPESSLSKAERNLGTLFIDKTAIITPELEKYGTIAQLMAVKFHLFSLGGELLSHQGSPLFLLDGMPVDFEGIATLPVSLIERIDIVNNAYGMFGQKGKYGAISYTTKNDWGSTHSPYYHSANIKFSGYNEPRIFYSPKHHTTLESDYKPDLRTTLFWEPDISIENNKEIVLTYFNADNSSRVKVVIEGITTAGIPVTGTTDYEVK